MIKNYLGRQRGFLVAILGLGLLIGCSSGSSTTGTTSTTAFTSGGNNGGGNNGGGNNGGGNGAGSTVGGSSGTSSTTGPECSGTELSASGALDLDITGQGGSGGTSGQVLLTGHVTLNQAALPSANGDRGQLLFNGAHGGSASVPLESSGDITYQVEVVPDVYTVTLSANPELCGSGSAMPCVGGILQQAVSVGTGGGALDINIPSVQVTGAVTVNGQPMPAASGSRGSVSFVGQAGASAATATALDFGASGAASYQLSLLPGTYDVTFNGNEELCRSSSLPGVPCNGATIRSGVALQASGALDLDVGAIQVTGQVTLNGGALTGASIGNLIFESPGGVGVTSLDLGSGQNQYGFTLVPGTYDVSWSSSEEACDGTSAPCNGGPLKSGVSLTSGGALDLDVKSVQVTGQVTVNGQPMPSASGSRGALSFTGSAGSQVSSVSTSDFGSGGAAQYSISVLAGTYDITYSANSDLCQLGNALPAVPCISGVVKSSVALDASGALDIDLPVIQATGNVTLNGAAFPGADGSRGSLSFADVAGDEVSAGDFGSSGAGIYGVTLLAGTYNINYVADASLCSNGQISAFPCVGGSLRTGLTLNQSGALDVDVPAIQVGGNVTLGGQVLPDESQGRGSIEFTGEPGGDSVSLDLGASGPGKYAVTLIPGRYAIGYTNAPSLCGTGSFPCAPEELLGCP